MKSSRTCQAVMAQLVSVGLVADGLRVRGSGSCNAVMLATGSPIHKNGSPTVPDGYLFK